MTARPLNISPDAPEAPGIYWQSRMGNNHDGIGGNCHRYDIVEEGPAPARHRVIVDYGIKFGGSDPRHDCEFPSPEGLFRKRSDRAAPSGQEPEALLLTHCHEDHIGAIRHAMPVALWIAAGFAAAGATISVLRLRRATS